MKKTFILYLIFLSLTLKGEEKSFSLFKYTSKFTYTSNLSISKPILNKVKIMIRPKGDNSNTGPIEKGILFIDTMIMAS